MAGDTWGPLVVLNHFGFVGPTLRCPSSWGRTWSPKSWKTPLAMVRPAQLWFNHYPVLIAQPCPPGGHEWHRAEVQGAGTAQELSSRRRLEKWPHGGGNVLLQVGDIPWHSHVPQEGLKSVNPRDVRKLWIIPIDLCNSCLLPSQQMLFPGCHGNPACTRIKPSPDPSLGRPLQLWSPPHCFLPGAQARQGQGEEGSAFQRQQQQQRSAVPSPRVP